jgi:hypothetical protein
MDWELSLGPLTFPGAAEKKFASLAPRLFADGDMVAKVREEATGQQGSSSRCTVPTIGLPTPQRRIPEVEHDNSQVGIVLKPGQTICVRLYMVGLCRVSCECCCERLYVSPYVVDPRQ